EALVASLKLALSLRGNEVVEVASCDAALDVARTHGVDLAIIDLDLDPTPTGHDVRELRRVGRGCLVMCLADAASRGARDEATKAGATAVLARPQVGPRQGRTQAARPPEKDDLLREVGRLLMVREHRRGLVACEEGEAACVLKQPVAPRSRSRFRRAATIAAVVVVALAAVAVPVVLKLWRSAAKVVEEGGAAARDTAESIQRVEGYLQRDEQRELDAKGR
ncbi:MAG: response regulator, partial [Planctomycetota bacterium]